MAETAEKEFYNPAQDENYPFPARLTNEDDMKMVTSESGDLFNWLKDQAKKGVASAQVRIKN